MEELRLLVLDHVHTRGKVTQFKYIMYLYWLTKSILGKTMGQISVSMATVVQDFHNYKQDFQKLQFQMQKKEGCIGCMEGHFPYLLSQTKFRGPSAKDIAQLHLPPPRKMNIMLVFSYFLWVFMYIAFISNLKSYICIGK